MRPLLRGAITAALNGGAAALGQIAFDPLHFDWKHTGAAFVAGAAIGLINWLRTSPWDQAQADWERTIAAAVEERAQRKAAGE